MINFQTLRTSVEQSIGTIMYCEGGDAMKVEHYRTNVTPDLHMYTTYTSQHVLLTLPPPHAHADDPTKPTNQTTQDRPFTNDIDQEIA